MALSAGSTEDVMNSARELKVEFDRSSGWALGNALGTDASFDQGRQLIKTLTADDRDTLSSFYDVWFTRDTGQAIKEMAELDTRTRETLIDKNARVIATYDPEGAQKIAASLEDHLSREALLEAIAQVPAHP